MTQESQSAIRPFLPVPAVALLVDLCLESVRIHPFESHGWKPAPLHRVAQGQEFEHP